MLEVNHFRVSTVILVAVVLVARALALVGAKPAEAAFPGTNGKKIVFSNNRIATTSPTGDYEIFTMTAGVPTRPASPTTPPPPSTWNPTGNRSRKGNGKSTQEGGQG